MARLLEAVEPLRWIAQHSPPCLISATWHENGMCTSSRTKKSGYTTLGYASATPVVKQKMKSDKTTSIAQVVPMSTVRDVNLVTRFAITGMITMMNNPTRIIT